MAKRMTANPPWATRAVTRAWDAAMSRVAEAWRPRLDDVQFDDGDVVTAVMREYGCGTYGCAYPTYDPGVVMKVTTDPSEAGFAANIAGELAAPICVRYFTVMRLDAQHEGNDIYLLWRESAQDVGKVKAVAGKRAYDMVSEQFEIAKEALLMLEEKVHGRPVDDEELQAALGDWETSCLQIADMVPEMAELWRGVVRVFQTQQIFFGDIHVGNLGRVMRDGTLTWVITDPGNIAMLDGSSPEM